MADNLAVFTDQNWKADVLGSAQPVLVDFWAEWCVPCKTLVPTLEALAKQFEGRLRIGKLNVEENNQVPFDYKVTTLPTLLLFKGGSVAEQRVGLISKDQLAKLIEPHLG
jgi:thioredoxin 1